MADLTAKDAKALARLLGAKLGDNGQVGQRFEWKDGTFLELHVEGDRIRFDYLMAHPTGQPQTREDSAHRLTQLALVLPAFFRKRGIVEFVTSYSGANDAIRAVGFQDVAPNQLVQDIGEGCRADEYAAWKQGKADRPQWHT
jgi:hypothetical protein